MRWEQPWKRHIVRWLRRAADQGQPWAVTRLANDDYLDGVTAEERQRWLARSAASGNGRSAFLLALYGPEDTAVEDLLRFVWRAANHEQRTGLAVGEDFDPDMGPEAAHLLAKLAAQRGDPEAEQWFDRATNSEDWFERETGANRNCALLDYSRWATREGHHELAETLLAQLTAGALKSARLTSRAMEDEYKSYRDYWQDNNADSRVWSDATIEHAALLTKLGYAERADLILRLASENQHFSSAALPVVCEVLEAMGPDVSARALLAQMAESVVPPPFEAPVGAMLRGTSSEPSADGRQLAYAMLDWLVHEYLAGWLSMAGAEDVANSVRYRVAPIVDASSAESCRARLVNLPIDYTTLTPQATVDDPDGEEAPSSFIEQLEFDRVRAVAIRAVMQSVGADVSADLAEPAGVPDADIAASRRLLSGSRLWLTFWAATVEDAEDHPWLTVWDSASRHAWEAARVASHKILVQERVRTRGLDAAAVLKGRISPFQKDLQRSVLEACLWESPRPVNED